MATSLNSDGSPAPDTAAVGRAYKRFVLIEKKTDASRGDKYMSQVKTAIPVFLSLITGTMIVIRSCRLFRQNTTVIPSFQFPI